MADESTQRLIDTLRRSENHFAADHLSSLLVELQQLRATVEPYEEWSNEIAELVPERYEASEGSQEGCISAWLRDVLADRDAYRTALKSISLGHTQCGCGEVPAIAGDALRAARSGEYAAEVAAEMAEEGPY